MPIQYGLMKADTGPDVFLSKKYHIGDKRSALDEVVSTERLTTIILDGSPAEMHSIIKLKARRNPDLNLEQNERTSRTIFIDHS